MFWLVTKFYFPIKTKDPSRYKKLNYKIIKKITQTKNVDANTGEKKLYDKDTTK